MPPAADRGRFRELLDRYGFEFIARIFTAGDALDGHLESFRRQLAEAQGLRPRLVNSHSGLDACTESESERFFAVALDIASRMGAAVAHETHRGRVLFNPWVTRRLLARLEGLRLCCDFSHWVSVAERLLDDQIEVLRQYAARCDHLHARVGYEQGPQVPDPRAPEYQPHLEAPTNAGGAWSGTPRKPMGTQKPP